ncbi:MAG: BTAD domain-containing putative transcriptional regulator [Chloroflexota bacterium]
MAETSHALKACLFGSFQLSLNDTPLTAFHSKKARSLLAYLLIEANYPHTRDFLATLFWGDQTTQKARTNLRTTFAKLRHMFALLDNAGAFFTVTRQTIQLNINTDHHWVDVQVFDSLLSDYENASFDDVRRIEPYIPALTKAVALYQGDFLSDLAISDAEAFETWRVGHQEAFHMRILRLLSNLTAFYQTQNDPLAEQYARQQLTLEPWREIAHLQLMQILTSTGQRGAALAQYERCRQILADEMGLEPSPEITTLATQIQNNTEGIVTNDQASKVIADTANLATQAASSEVTPRHDWHEMPPIDHFFGREKETAQLQQWLIDARHQLVFIVGIGGVGKTSLAARVVGDIADQFDLVIWRSLLNAPTLSELLSSVIPIVSQQKISTIPESIDEQLRLFFSHLQEERVLLILDNVESILESGQAGQYRLGYEPYTQLITGFVSRQHQGHLLLTSREVPQGLLRFKQGPDNVQIQSLSLEGLDDAASRQLLSNHGITGTNNDEATLTSRYSGNPLALKLVADTVQDLFLGNLREFLTEETIIFDDVRHVLDQQFERLGELEQEILCWLALERETLSVQHLQQNLLQTPSRRNLLEALSALRRRSLIYRQPAGFSLQNVIIEYLTERLVETAIHELTTGKFNWLHRYPLMKAQSKEYVRQSQIRLLLQPVLQHLQSAFALDQLVAHFQQHLDALRRDIGVRPSYVSGTMLNILLHLDIDVSQWNFSYVSIRQADLRNRRVTQLNLTGSDLVSCAFTQTFSRITAVAISADGALLACGGDGGEIRLYQLPDNQLTRILSGHTNSISALAFSPDGNFLASGAEDGQIRLWNLRQDFAVQTLGGDTPYRAIAFSPDSSVLVYAGFSRQVQVWNVKQGVLQQTLEIQTHRVEAITFNSRGDLLAVGTYDGNIELWHVNNTGNQTTNDTWHLDFTPFTTFNGDDGSPILSFAFDQESTTLSAGNRHGNIAVWDIQEKRHRHTYTGHVGPVYALAISPDDLTLFSGSNDKTIRLWDTSNHQVLKILTEHEETVWSLALTPDGHFLASGGEEGVVRLWDVKIPERSSSFETLYGYRQSLYGVSWSANGRWLATRDVHGTVRLWEIEDSMPQSRYFIEGTNVATNVDFKPNSQWLAIANDIGVQIWDVENQVKLGVIPNLTQQKYVSFAPNGIIIATAGDDGVIRLWDITSPERAEFCLALTKHTDYPGIVFSPTGELLISWEDRVHGHLCVWDVNTGRLIRRQESKNAIGFVMIDPTGQFMAFEGPDFHILLWDLTDLSDTESNRSFIGHTHRVSSVSFSPDSTLLVSGSLDRSVRLWDVVTGEQIALLGHHSQYVNDVVFSPDGQYVASVGKEGALLVWRVKDGSCVHTIQAPGPYEGLNIYGVTGITEPQRLALKALGAVEIDVDNPSLTSTSSFK